jgi:hypothetical protein
MNNMIYESEVVAMDADEALREHGRRFLGI